MFREMHCLKYEWCHSVIFSKRCRRYFITQGVLELHGTNIKSRSEKEIPISIIILKSFISKLYLTIKLIMQHCHIVLQILQRRISSNEKHIILRILRNKTKIWLNVSSYYLKNKWITERFVFVIKQFSSKRY